EPAGAESSASAVEPPAAEPPVTAPSAGVDAGAAPAESETPANSTATALPSGAGDVGAGEVADEYTWTAAELDEIRAQLEAEIDRLRREIEVAESGLAERMRDGGDGAGDDQADAGTKTFEREHEMSLANNARDLLVQTEHALARIADGTYGRCENCGNPINKLRLQANPRATLCVSCKQREERR
ncbi:MAG: TraR/DksA C4-type zinc finger protein, partial [Acidothermus cellulolyticus]|nr:TraR/DksA C4-type zinc finger protein [Acidothermus cellulolyticus]